MTKFNLNIAIVGCISSGKSTLLNSIFIEQYSNMKIKRDTMVPQVYKETNDETKYKSKEEILKENIAINEKYQVDSESEFILDECDEVEHFIPKNNNFIEMDEEVFINYYDIPGLNDCATKDIYYEWFTKNFYRFDMIIYIVDINSAMNTSDEKDILNIIKTNIINMKENEGRDIKLIILVNKCDDLVFTDTTTSLHINNEYFTLDDDELDGMYKQIQTVFNNNLKDTDIKYEVTPISAIDIFVYRHLQNKPDIELDIKLLNKFGENEFGRRVWKRMNIEEKKEKIHHHFKDKDNYNEALKNTGFINMVLTIKNILNDDDQFNIFSDKIKNRLSLLANNINLENVDEIIEKYTNIYDRIEHLNNIYKQSSTNSSTNLYSIFVNNMKYNICYLIKTYMFFNNNNIYDLEKLEKYKDLLKKFYFNIDITSYPLMNINEENDNVNEVGNIKCLLDNIIKSISQLQNEFYIKEISVYGEAFNIFPNNLIDNYLEKLNNNNYDKFEKLIDNIFILLLKDNNILNSYIELNKDNQSNFIKFCNYVNEKHNYPLIKVLENLEKWLLNIYIVKRFIENENNKYNVMYPYLIQYNLIENNFYKKDNNPFYKKLFIMNAGAVYYDLSIEDLDLIDEEENIIQVFNYYRKLYIRKLEFTYETDFSDDDVYHSSDN